MSVVPAMLSERLGLPGLTLAAQLGVEGGAVTIRRDGDDIVFLNYEGKEYRYPDPLQ